MSLQINSAPAILGLPFPGTEKTLIVPAQVAKDTYNGC